VVCPAEHPNPIYANLSGAGKQPSLPAVGETLTGAVAGLVALLIMVGLVSWQALRAPVAPTPAALDANLSDKIGSKAALRSTRPVLHWQFTWSGWRGSRWMSRQKGSSP
jgi:hypothetical protein